MKAKFTVGYDYVWTINETKQAKNLQKAIKDFDMKHYESTISRMCNYDMILKIDTEIATNNIIDYNYYAEDTGCMDVLITIYRLDYLRKFSIHYIWLSDIMNYDGAKRIEDMTNETVVYNRERK